MQRFYSAGLIIFAIAFGLGYAHAQHPSLPSPVIPEGFGVNIHFTDPEPGEMKKIAESGVRWVRMDLGWEGTEREKGVYDFSAYDRLVKNLDEYGLKALFILDYGNPLYDQGLAPHSEEGRQAFARWAVAAAKHFAGKGYLWEIWNEPNRKQFWRPRSNAKNYANLAQAVGAAFQQHAPGEALIGPATARFSHKFLKQCLDSEVLKYWAAISFHPYRFWLKPESAIRSYSRIRKLLAAYSTEGKNIPIVSGEWGYSDVQLFLNREKQAQFLARMYLFNLSAGIPLSIWYDWRDDGTDPREKEHHFGMVENDFKNKPAYRAAKTMISQLKGFKFRKRLKTEDEKDYVLLFEKGPELRLAVWTTGGRKISIRLPDFSGSYIETDYLGENSTLHLPDKSGLRVRLEQGPRYFAPTDSISGNGSKNQGRPGD